MSGPILHSDQREAETVVSDLLDGGESLLWAAQPRQGIFLRGGDAFMIPFSLLWGGFAIFWETGVLNSNAPFFFALWGIPFVAVGVYIVIGRFAADAWIRSRTYYGVTDRRVIIHRRTFGLRTTSFDRDNLPTMAIDEYGNGRATIRLGQVPAFAHLYEGMPWPGMGRYQCTSLEQIADGKRVFELLSLRS